MQIIVGESIELMSRALNPGEKKAYRKAFPDLDVDRAVVTGANSGRYNCIAWTLGITERWVWPGSSEEAFNELYAEHGMKPKPQGRVAAWQLPAGAHHPRPHMTHGSISGAGHGPRWESKMGGLLRIQHDRDELAGQFYGRVNKFFEPAGGQQPFINEFDQPPRKPQRLPVLSPAERAKLEKAAAQIPASVRQHFETNFQAWKRTWFDGSLGFDSDPTARAQGEHFATLLAMGGAILPLVTQAMIAPHNFFALQLYDAIRRQEAQWKEFILPLLPRDKVILDGEQSRARLAARRWLAGA